jgi:hypothetical protein
VIRPKSKAEMIGEEQLKWFRSTIGTLLYFVKLSCPDIAIPVRELSKMMDGAVQAHEKELKRITQFVFQTKGKRINIITTVDAWEIEANSDSDFVGDKDGMKSITGYVKFLSSAVISWKL